MRVAVFGATGGAGRAVIAQALGAGHSVTAFARAANRIAPAEGLTVIEGDVMVAADGGPALVGQDAIVIALGNSQNAFALLLCARCTTPRDVCKVGTRNILDALADTAEIPVVVVGAFGSGDTRAHLPFAFKLFYKPFLREQMADKEWQDAILKASTARYTLIQPVALTDKPAMGTWTTSRDGAYGKAEVSRADLAAFIMESLARGDAPGGTIASSG
jgi:putative NADH-flavin reductase